VTVVLIAGIGGLGYINILVKTIWNEFIEHSRLYYTYTKLKLDMSRVDWIKAN
jgi:polyphosphate kinase